jgi:hypothetical protein
MGAVATVFNKRGDAISAHHVTQEWKQELAGPARRATLAAISTLPNQLVKLARLHKGRRCVSRTPWYRTDVVGEAALHGVNDLGGHLGQTRANNALQGFAIMTPASQLASARSFAFHWLASLLEPCRPPRTGCRPHIPQFCLQTLSRCFSTPTVHQTA